MKNSKLIITFLLILFSLSAFSCKESKTDNLSIAVFVPGIIENSPVYEMLTEGVSSAIDKFNVDKAEEEIAHLHIMEAGTNQAEWSSKIMALTAEGKYDVIISSNPSLPDLIVPITKQFPNQKFILLDAELSGNENIYTARYNQKEQAFLSGYISALMSKSNKLGLIAAQEYPVMNQILHPYFEKGAKAANPASTVEFRLVGNWYDANKAAVIADSLIDGGVDVILPICGSAVAGVINSATNKKAYISWFDNNGFNKAPGTIISSSVVKQEELAEIVTSNYLNNNITWGESDVFGMEEGFVEFIEDDPLYIEHVPTDIRIKMKTLIEKITNKEITIQ